MNFRLNMIYDLGKVSDAEYLRRISSFVCVTWKNHLFSLCNAPCISL